MLGTRCSVLFLFPVRICVTDMMGQLVFARENKFSMAWLLTGQERNLVL